MLGRPLPAAVVGLAVGLLGASLTFGYVVPLFLHVATLVNDSFESGPAPISMGMPCRPGVWSGDLSQVVGPSQGVTPHSGGKMLRLHRREYANTLKDLLGVEINVSELPSDTGPGGFDTVGSNLFMSANKFD
jgi:hypothetical protein